MQIITLSPDVDGTIYRCDHPAKIINTGTCAVTVFSVGQSAALQPGYTAFVAMGPDTVRIVEGIG